MSVEENVEEEQSGLNLNLITIGHDRLQAGTTASLDGRLPGSSLESDVVDRVLAGDTQAFAVIVQRWQGPLVNMAWRYCRDRGRAEEMAQEALIRAWRGLRQWRRESSFSTWLFSVAANVYRTELKRIPSVSISLDQAAEPSSPFAHDAQLDGAARDEAVRRAVLALPEKYREPTILFYFHEMDLAAAAATMGLPEGTMKARLSRARAVTSALSAVAGTVERRRQHMNQPDQLEGQLDRILAHEDALVPSSGFAASVMDAIQEQAAEPAPIPFPWKLALPGIAALVAAIVIIVRLTASAIQGMGHNSGAASSLSQANLNLTLSSFARVQILGTQAGPALLALAAALICTLICSRLGARSAR